MMSYLGISSIEELPEYNEINSSIQVAAQNLVDELKKEEDESSN
jgi:hypothetical protein